MEATTKNSADPVTVGVTDAATMLGCHPAKVRSLYRTGTLKGWLNGNKIRIFRDSVMSLAQSGNRA